MKTCFVKLSAVLLAALFLAGCTAKVTNLQLVSNKNIDIKKRYVLVQENVSETSPRTLILIFYFGGEDLSYYAALGRCLTQYGGDLMTNCKITTSSYWFLIGAYTNYKVEGDVWKMVDEQAAAHYAPEELYELATLDGQPYLVRSDGSDRRKVFQAQL